MIKENCGACAARALCANSRTSLVFFLIGIVATVAMRVIEPLRTIGPAYAKASWYIGVAGFFLFFIYKYRELAMKSGLIRDNRLLEKLSNEKALSGDDYSILAALVCSQDNRKERENFFIIFASSAIVLLFALYSDFFG
jgi:hypothetical protein